MLELYGRQWEASYGHVDGDVFPAWRDALASMKPEHIKRGLDGVIKEGSEYPPNLIKFLRLCRDTGYTTMSPQQTALPKPDVIHDPKTIKAKEACLKAARDMGILK